MSRVLMDRRSRRRGLVGAAVLLGLVLPQAAAALVVTRAQMNIVPKRSDKFRIEGRVAAGELAGIRQVRLQVDALAWTVAVTPRRTRLEYRGPRGVVGLDHLVLYLKTGKLVATGKGLALSGIENPIVIRFAAGGASECATAALAARGGRRRYSPITLRLVGKESSSCAFAGAPLLDPPSVAAAIPTEVQVNVTDAEAVALDAGSVQLVRLDSSGQPTNAACALRDDGTGGDAVAGDGIFGCRATFVEPAEGPLRLRAQAMATGVPVVSPGAVLLVVRPLDAAATAATLAAQEAADATWVEKRAALGDGLEARVETVRALRLLDEVQDVGVSEDGRDVWIRYRSGVLGLLTVVERPGETPTGGSDRGVALGVPPALRSRARAASVVGATTVTSWDPGFFGESESITIRRLLGLSTAPVFTVRTVDGGAASLGSLAAALVSGTFAAVTHGAVWKHQVSLMTSDAPADVLAQYGQSGEIAISKDKVFALPAFVAHQAGRSWNGLAYLGACSSLVNDTLARALHDRGFATVLGFSSPVRSAFAEDAAEGLFCGMLAGRLTAGDAYDAIKKKTDPSGGTTFLLSGDRSLAYPGPPLDVEPFEVTPEPARMCVGRGSGAKSVRVQVPEDSRALVECFEYAWENTGRIGDLDGGNRQTTNGASVDYVSRASVPAGGDATDVIAVTARIGEKDLATTSVAVTGICLDVDFSKVTIEPADAQIDLGQALTLTVKGAEACPDVVYSWLGTLCGSMSAQEPSTSPSNVFDPRGGETPCEEGQEVYPTAYVEARPDLPCNDPQSTSALSSRLTATLTVVSCTKCQTGARASTADECPLAEACCNDGLDNDHDGLTDCDDDDCECCPAGEQVCGSGCCAAGRACCDGACCAAGQVCRDGSCGSPSCWWDFECGGSYCCGGTCCGPEDICGNGFVCEACPGACIGGQCRDARQGLGRGAACAKDLVCCSLSCVGAPDGVCG